MKSFFKTVLACMLGVLLLWFVVFLFVIVISASFSGKKPVVKDESVLVLDLNGVEMEERVSIDNPLHFLKGNEPLKIIGLNDWNVVLKAAAEDRHIKGVSLIPGNFSASPATLNAMRNALQQFKDAGKFIYAYDNNYSQNAYFLASVADSIFLNPLGVVNIYGLAAQVIYYKDLLDKYDIEMQVIRHGSYKSAAEPYMASRMSSENREQISVYLTSIWGHMCETIAKSRKKSVKQINSVADHLVLANNASVALSTHFVEQLVYQDEYEELLRMRIQNDSISDLKINKINYSDYKKNISSPKSTPYKVAIVYANGIIAEGKGSSEKIGDNFVDELRKLREKKDIKAVVLRVNSGGGNALLSDRIWREVKLMKEVKPIVVSMGDYAASGGYYISCAADYIVAEPTTITGSIGVFGIIPNFSRILSNKLGINVETVKTNPYSDMSSTVRPMTVYERNVMQHSTDIIYDTFVKRVADGRNLTLEYVDQIAQGRVWTGKDALGIGLVDTLGGLEVAVAYAVKKAGLAHYSVVERPVMENFISSFTTSMRQTRQQRMLEQWRGTAIYPFIKLSRTLEEARGVQALLPYQLEFE